MRSIYYYHAVTKGWGDIGYNFLVDRNGVVYEGRFGGENVVGGHALKYNYGSLGIGVIGSFATTPDPAPAEAATIALTAFKGRFVDPLGQYFFVDKMIPNIVGHRDVLSTACPGNAFYPRLPIIRQEVSKILGMTPKMDVAITAVEGRGTSTPIQVPYLVRVTVKNIGTSVIPSYYDAGLAYLDTDTYDSKGMAKVQGRFRIVADLEGSPTFGTDKANPWRWGFGRSLNPGESAEVDCRIAFTTTGRRTLRFGLIQENVAYKQQGLQGPTVTVVGNPVYPVQPPAAPVAGLAYFEPTRHTLRGVFLRYWEKFCGLAQFGYPLTEEFLEISETDGKEYLVQYFERARFEHHPEYADSDYEVLLGMAGRRYHAVDKPAPPLTTAGTIYHPETGHNLGGFFRTYWETYGGLFVYGYPITEEFKERSLMNGQESTVQYFERARFEWHPENTGKSRVLLGHLGRQMLQDRGWLPK